jgi:hypothetical protein
MTPYFHLFIHIVPPKTRNHPPQTELTPATNVTICTTLEITPDSIKAIDLRSCASRLLDKLLVYNNSIILCSKNRISVCDQRLSLYHIVFHPGFLFEFPMILFHFLHIVPKFVLYLPYLQNSRFSGQFDEE